MKFFDFWAFQKCICHHVKNISFKCFLGHFIIPPELRGRSMFWRNSKSESRVMIRVVHSPNFRQFFYFLSNFELLILLHQIFCLKILIFAKKWCIFDRNLNCWRHSKRSNCSFAKEKIDSKSKLSFLLKLKINLYLKCNLSLTKRHFQNNVKSCELKH